MLWPSAECLSLLIGPSTRGKTSPNAWKIRIPAFMLGWNFSPVRSKSCVEVSAATSVLPSRQKYLFIYSRVLLSRKQAFEHVPSSLVLRCIPQGPCMAAVLYLKIQEYLVQLIQNCSFQPSVLTPLHRASQRELVCKCITKHVCSKRHRAQTIASIISRCTYLARIALLGR